MKTKTPSPTVTLSTAEKVIRDIARREGEGIRKRRSKTLIEYYGMGYMVYDPYRNVLLSGYICGLGQDGCGDTLVDLANRYEDAEENTPRQKLVLKAIKDDAILE